MTEQEKINSDVQTKLAIHDEKKDFRQEMRDIDNQWHESVLDIQTRFQNMQNILMEMQTCNRNKDFFVIIGVAAMVVAVILK